MRKEDKDLLFRYLCMALPYGLICSIYRIDDWGVGWRDEKLTGYFDNGMAYEFDFGESPISIDNDISKIKPYLRPMSSMTEEEKKEFDDFCVIDEFAWKGNSDIGYKNQAIIMSDAINWLLEKHFDFMGLIPKGIAIEVTEENNPYKTMEE